MIKLKRPNVSTIAGKLSIISTGLIRAFTTPNTKLATTITVILSASMPLKNTEARKSPTKFASHVSKNLLITGNILAHFQVKSQLPANTLKYFLGLGRSNQSTKLINASLPNSIKTTKMPNKLLSCVRPYAIYLL